MLEESTSRRLAFIRYLYTQAFEQADQPEPFCAASVLSFRDAIEMFLGLACEHKDVSVPVSINFIAVLGTPRSRAEARQPFAETVDD